MDILTKFLSIEFSLFEILGYRMSVIELVGTSIGLISVWLATKANIHTWSTGILNVIAFFIIFYQIQLYSDMLLQAFFFGASVLGILRWKKSKPVEKDKKVSFLSIQNRVIIGLTIIIASVSLGLFMANIHIILSNVFTQKASFPFADAVTTVLSIYATFLMAYKKIESWILWIIVDIICVVLYYQKSVMFISFEYLIFLIMASIGLVEWLKSFKYAERISAR